MTGWEFVLKEFQWFLKIITYEQFQQFVPEKLNQLYLGIKQIKC